MGLIFWLTGLLFKRCQIGVVTLALGKRADTVFIFIIMWVLMIVFGVESYKNMVSYAVYQKIMYTKSVIMKTSLTSHHLLILANHDIMSKEIETAGQ